MSRLMNLFQLGEVGRRRELRLLICLGVMEGFSWTLIKPMLPLFAEVLGAREALIGAIVAVPPLIQIFTRIPSGMAAARFGKKRMIVISFVATMAGAFVMTVTRSVWLLFPAQVCVALGESFFWPANWAYVTSLAPPRRKGTLVGLVMGIQSVAGLFLPYVAGVIFDAFGFWLNGLIYGLFATAGFFVARRLPATEPEDGPDAVAESAAAAPSQSGGSADAPAKGPGLGRDAGSRRPLGGPGPGVSARALLSREMVLLAAWCGIAIFVSWGINSALFSLYVKELGFSATSIGILLTWQSGFVVAARFAYAGLGRDIPVDRALLGTMLLNVVPLMLLPWARSFPLLMAVTAATGCASGVVPVAIKTLYANATSDRERSLAMGIDGVAMNLGALVSPLAAGAVAQVAGMPATFFGGNLLVLMGILVARPLARSRRVQRAVGGRDARLADGQADLQTTPLPGGTGGAA
jgi:MFS family permease